MDFEELITDSFEGKREITTQRYLRPPRSRGQVSTQRCQCTTFLRIALYRMVSATSDLLRQN
jgi:hypothetical protein